MNDKHVIKSWLKNHKIKNYEIIEVTQNFVVNVEGDVDLRRKNLKHIPVKFDFVSGSFDCASNSLINLYNAPRSVGSEFTCASNMLISL